VQLLLEKWYNVPFIRKGHLHTMYKIITILILLVILFFMVRRALRDWGQPKVEKATPGKDVMIQDPVCKVYVAAGTAIVEEVGGKDYYFCSQDCARHFTRGGVK
jgi:YHS domain-containing protein